MIKSSELKAKLPFKTSETIESVTAYNWSPTDHDLAIAYGDTNSSKIAIYSADNHSFTLVPSSTAYRSTAFVLWLKDGRALDFVSEQPSDQYRLYRFLPQRHEVNSVLALSRDNLLELNNLGPKYSGD